MRHKNVVLRQQRLPRIGGLKQILAQTAFWMSMMNFVLIAVTAYWTTLRPLVLQHAPWAKLWMFLGFLVAVVLVAMFIEYKWIYPSWLAFHNRQEYEHENLIRRDLAKIKEKLGIDEDTDSPS